MSTMESLTRGLSLSAYEESRFARGSLIGVSIEVVELLVELTVLVEDGDVALLLDPVCSGGNLVRMARRESWAVRRF